MKITLLTQDGAPCAIVKNYLLDKDVEFTEINVSKTPEAIDKFGISSAPVVVIGNDTGELARVVGANIPGLEKAIELYKENQSEY